MTRRTSSWVITVVVIGLALAGVAAKGWPKGSGDQRIPVTLHVDFGLAGKPVYDGELLVDPGSTPKDVVSVVFPIQSGSICCHTRELSAIDGVRAEPPLNRWWTCVLNGSGRVSPFRTALRRGDRVEWRYIEQSQ